MIPLAKANGVYLYDFIGKESIIGVETPVVKFTKAKDLTLSIGVLTDAGVSEEGELRKRERMIYQNGTPFIGIHIPVNMESDSINVGAFLSRNLEEGKNIAGIKASAKFW